MDHKIIAMSELISLYLQRNKSIYSNMRPCQGYPCAISFIYFCHATCASWHFVMLHNQIEYINFVNSICCNDGKGLSKNECRQKRHKTNIGIIKKLYIIILLVNLIIFLLAGNTLTVPWYYLLCMFYFT